jgi:pyruvate kinase
MLREALKQRPRANVAIMLDTKGPEIRTGLLKDHKDISLIKDQILEISTDYTLEGDSNCITCSYKSLPNSVKVGGKLLMADGNIMCEVVEVMEVILIYK